MIAYVQKNRERLFGSGFQLITVMPSNLEQKLRLDENRVVQEFVERCFKPQATRYAFAQYARTGEPLFDDYLSTVVAGTWKGIDSEQAHLLIGYRPEPESMKEYASTRVALGVCASGHDRWVFVPGRGLTFHGSQTLENVHEALQLSTVFMSQYEAVERWQKATPMTSNAQAQDY